MDQLDALVGEIQEKINSERTKMSFLAAHLFILSQQLDQMRFMRSINDEITSIDLPLSDSGYTVPFVAESCGEWVVQKGENYKIKILTYEYSAAAVDFLREKIDGQCSDLEQEWLDYHGLIDS